MKPELDDNQKAFFLACKSWLRAKSQGSSDPEPNPSSFKLSEKEGSLIMEMAKAE